MRKHWYKVTKFQGFHPDVQGLGLAYIGIDKPM